MNRIAPVAQAPFSLPRLLGWARQAVQGIGGPFALVIAMSIFTGLLSAYNAQLIANFIGQAQGAAKPPSAQGFNIVTMLLPQDTAWTAILFAVTALVLIGFGFANRVGARWFDIKMLQRLQLRLHDTLLRMGPAYHGAHDMGENTAVLMQYATGAQPALRDVLSFPFVRGVSLATAIVFLFYNLSGVGSQGVIYVLLAVLLIVLPAGGIWLSSKLRVAFSAMRDRQAELGNAVVDSLTAPQEVQLMNAGAQRSAAFKNRLDALGRAQVQSTVQSEISTQFQAAVPTLLQIGLILWAVFAVGGDAVQAVIGIYLFVPRVVQPIQELVNFYAQMNSAWPNVEKVGQILEMPLEVTDSGASTAADLKRFDVALHELTFRPDADRTILDAITHAFEPGKITALVGRSGSGKTTIFRLIARLFDPTSGKVTIGGIDIRDLKLASLRSITATVSQFPMFIEASVRENMALGVPDASDAAMEQACRAADIWNALAVISPADPLAAPVPRIAGKSGLAGGERRRLAIARTLLSNARILLLDEPSTGIDAMSISKILQEFRNQPDRTILLIDHDMELVRAVADRICCIEGGKFTAIGSPEELLARPSLFKTLWDARRAYGDNAEFEVHGSVPVRPSGAGGPPPGAVAAKPAGGAATRPGGAVAAKPGP